MSTLLPIGIRKETEEVEMLSCLRNYPGFEIVYSRNHGLEPVTDARPSLADKVFISSSE